MHTQSSDIGTGLAAHPENTKMTIIVKFEKLAFVDCTHAKLTLDGRDERRTLEERTSQGLQSASHLCFTARQLIMEANDAHVLFSGTLLRLDKTSCAINADD
jgi:hypothetical protein